MRLKWNVHRVVFGLININALFYCLSHHPITMWGLSFLSVTLPTEILTIHWKFTTDVEFFFSSMSIWTEKNYHFSFWGILFCHGMPTVATVCWMLLISPTSAMISHYQIKSITRNAFKRQSHSVFYACPFFSWKNIFISMWGETRKILVQTINNNYLALNLWRFFNRLMCLW